MSISIPIPLGLDPGFGNFKAARVTGSGVKVATVPSITGIGHTDAGRLAAGLNGNSPKPRRGPDRVAFDSVEYLVGSDVRRFARPIQRLDYMRLAEGPEACALLYTTLYRLLGRGTHNLNLTIGLPVDLMADAARVDETLTTLREWVVGEHTFRVNRTRATICIHGIQAIAQPLGTYFAWGLDNAGQWTRAASDLKAQVAICDIGCNTLDLYTVEAGKPVLRYTDGSQLGVHRAARILAQHVRAAYGYELSLSEADDLLRQSNPTLRHAGGETDLTPLVEQSLAGALAEILDFAQATWGNARQFAHVLFTGGGATLLREGILRQYPHGVVIRDPVTANAVGMARLALRRARQQPAAAR